MRTEAKARSKPSARPKTKASSLVVARKLMDAIRDEFRFNRRKVKVESERLPGLDLRRIFVVAPMFRRMWFTEQQDYVWRIADEALTKREQMSISMIVTLTPEDVS